MLRTVGTRDPRRDGAERAAAQARVRAPIAGRPSRSRAGRSPVGDEILRLGGPRGRRQLARLAQAADAYAGGREKEAARLLARLRDELPESPSVRELLGLSLYRLGRYRQAQRELEAYVTLTGDVDQHPVLMDCARATRDRRRIDLRWAELRAASPSAELVTEGRIVMAGWLADQGRMGDAIALLARRADDVRRPQDHHLRLWYALADLEERAGNLARARALFQRVRRRDPAFADVAERLLALA